MVVGPSRQWRRERLVVFAGLAGILAVTVLTRLPLLGAQELEYDEGVYWASLRSLQAGNALATAVYSSQPPGFLMLTQPPWALLGGSIAAARAVMLAWSVVGITAAAVIGWRLAGAAAALAIPLLLAVDPLMVRQSVVLQADGPATSLALLAVAMAVVATTARRPRAADLAALAGGAALALGILTKLLDVAAVPVMALVLISSSGRGRRSVIAGAGFLLASAALLLPLHAAWAAIWDQAVGLHLASRAVPLGGLNREFGAVALRELPLIGLALLSLALVRRSRSPLTRTGLVWLAGAVLAMAATHPLWPHHAVAASPGLAMLGGEGIAAGVGWMTSQDGTRRRLQGVIAAAGAAAAALVLWLGLSVLQPMPGAATLQAALARTPAASPVVTDDQFAAAATGRDIPPQLVDTSLTRLWGTNVSAAAVETATEGPPPACAILLATHRLAQVPGLVGWIKSHFSDRVDLGAGRILYLRRGCPAA